MVQALTGFTYICRSDILGPWFAIIVIATEYYCATYSYGSTVDAKLLGLRKTLLCTDTSDLFVLRTYSTVHSSPPHVEQGDQEALVQLGNGYDGPSTPV